MTTIFILNCYNEYLIINNLSNINYSRNSSLVSIYEIYVIIRRDRENNRKIENRIYIITSRKDIGYLVKYPISSNLISRDNINKSSLNIISLKRY